MVSLWLAIFLHGVLAVQAASIGSRCSSMGSFSMENTRIIKAEYLPQGTNASHPEACPGVTAMFVNAVNICRVYGEINTTAESSTRFEAWLPDTNEWHGRYLFVGAGALGGCFDLPNLDYGSTQHFATIASDNGVYNNIYLADQFLNRPETTIDFSHRGAHATALVGKKLVETYYNTAPSKSYYLGCSAGGRQGARFALSYPDVFDGIVGGSPAVDFNHFWGATGMQSTYVRDGSEAAISPKQWSKISEEILKQCDGLDGLVDGIIADPDQCTFNPETLLCGDGSDKNSCLTPPQVDGLHKIYSPLTGSKQQVMYPRFDPGAEADEGYPISGQFNMLAAGWFQNTVFNDSHHSFENFSVKDIELADTINPGGIATWEGDMSAFRNRGGKFLTFHGTRDGAIPHGNSLRYYDLVSKTLAPSLMDPFYRFFVIPGMSHCFGGPGAWKIGQGINVGSHTNGINDTDHNILLAMVDWVEGDKSPEVLIGVDDAGKERRHCKYPAKSHWDGRGWVCT